MKRIFKMTALAACLLALFACQPKRQLTIIHVNDTHSHDVVERSGD